MSADDLESIELPKLKGTILELFSSALGNPLTRAVLMGPLLKNGGIIKLRSLRPTEPPTVYPLAFKEDPAARPIEADSLEKFANKIPHKGPFCSIRD